MPRGIPKKKPAVVVATEPEMHKVYVELPPDLYARVKRAAAEDERTMNVYIRRFLQANIDVIDTAGAAESAAEDHDEPEEE